MATLDELLAELNAAIKPLDDTDSHLKIMIYGPSGVGKTVEGLQLAQAITPTGKSILMVDAVEGWISAKNHPGLTKNVRRMIYQGISQLQTLCSAIAADVEGFGEIGTLILDELTTMSKKDLDVVLAARSKKDPSKDRDVPTQPDFYSNTERMRRFVVGDESKDIVGLLGLPINVIIIGHMRTDKNNLSVEVMAPAFMPKFSDTIKENLHIVAHMAANLVNDGEEELYVRTLQCFPTRNIVAKSRVAGLDKVLDTKSFNGILEKWTGGERLLVAEIETEEDDLEIEEETDGAIEFDSDS